MERVRIAIRRTTKPPSACASEGEIGRSGTVYLSPCGQRTEISKLSPISRTVPDFPPTEESAISNPNTKLVVAVLAVPDSTASTLYGMVEILESAGRDWGVVDRKSVV